MRHGHYAFLAAVLCLAAAAARAENPDYFRVVRNYADTMVQVCKRGHPGKSRGMQWIRN